MDTTDSALTIAQRRVLAAVTATPRTTAQVSDTIGVPRRATARANVSTVLAGLARLGLVTSQVAPGKGVLWTLATV